MYICKTEGNKNWNITTRLNWQLPTNFLLPTYLRGNHQRKIPSLTYIVFNYLLYARYPTNSPTNLPFLPTSPTYLPILLTFLHASHPLNYPLSPLPTSPPTLHTPSKLPTYGTYLPTLLNDWTSYPCFREHFDDFHLNNHQITTYFSPHPIGWLNIYLSSVPMHIT